MSMYRQAIQNGMLVRQKRRFFRFWQWAFNRSEEDHLVRMKNRLTAIRAEHTALMKMIPEHEEKVKKVKDHLKDTGGVGVPFRDTFSLRREPLKLNREVKLPKKKPDQPKKAEPKPLFTINQANNK